MNLYDYKLILAEKKRKVYSRNFGNVCAKAHPTIYVDRSSYLPILMGHGWQSNWFRNYYSKHTRHFATEENIVVASFWDFENTRA